MSLNLILNYLGLSAAISIAINYIFRNIAKNNKILIDLPDKSRKFHKRATPLTGGVAIMTSILVSGNIYLNINELDGFIPNFSYQMIIASIALVIFFLIDDAIELKPRYRIIAQILLAYYVIYTTDVRLDSFGNLMGFGEFSLGMFSIPVTIFCVVGLMNAFNMIDGINGLCSGFAMVMLLFAGFYSNIIFDSLLVFVIGGLIGFLVFNLRIFGKKRAVFLGDHGSNLIGFWVAWMAIFLTQNYYQSFNPITMIWLVAIPLLDCIGLIISRISRGQSWAAADRDHIHHKIMNFYSAESALSILLLFASTLSIIGIILDIYFKEYISFYLFIIFASAYYGIFFKILKKKEEKNV
jgi:UDP-GlcNAc:undecaprenyl-phosphate GlcNAc-1-phosphate transferase